MLRTITHNIAKCEEAAPISVLGHKRYKEKVWYERVLKVLCLILVIS